MAWKLWRLAALLTVLLAVTVILENVDATNAAEISIIGGNVMNIGDKAEIQCNYTYHPFYKPTFIINGVTTDLEENTDGLGEYAHNRSSIICPYARFGFCRVYTLTLSSVSRDYNGTTYQCHAWRHPSRKSGIVTLIVRDPATEEPTADKDSTPRTESTGNNTTNNMSASIPDTPTPAPTPSTATPAPTPSTATPAPTPTTATTPPEEFDEVELLIDGGPTFEVGTTAVIRCRYTGLIALSKPHFSINGKFYNSDNLQMALPQYQHAYNSGIEGDVLWANYSLTLPSVQIGDNGTTYQCSVDPIDLLRRYRSNTVILMVIEPATAVSPQDGSHGVVEVWHVVVPIVIVVVVAAALGAVCILIKASTVSNATNDRPHTIEDNKNEGESAGSTEMKVEANGEGGTSTEREEAVYTECNEETQFLE